MPFRAVESIATGPSVATAGLRRDVEGLAFEKKFRRGLSAEERAGRTEVDSVSASFCVEGPGFDGLVDATEEKASACVAIIRERIEFQPI
ncbi:MAG: hypothetical protein JWQ42_2622 [Edaphobacter sp.]|nr:hypothetical protein [Edaphobacter sp.]